MYGVSHNHPVGVRFTLRMNWLSVRWSACHCVLLVKHLGSPNYPYWTILNFKYR